MTSRLQNSIKNVKFSFFAYLLTLGLQFLNQTIFVKTMSAEYLGLNGLFTNILSFLALAELGIGSAINYALYKPLEENNIDLIKSIMYLYKKMYNVIGIVILCVGLILLPFLDVLIKDMPNNMEHIYLYYLLYLVNSVLSYFYTYKRSFIICNQKEYIATIISMICNIILKTLQIMILVFVKNYLFYLAVMLVSTLLENLCVSVCANRLYPFLKDKNVKPLNQMITNGIKKNVFAMIFHKVGEKIVFASDNIIISKFVGLVSVGYYSNYMLIIQAIKSLLNRFFNAITASVGNLVASGEKSHAEDVFSNILFVNAWMYGFCSIVLLCMLQPFVTLWIGKNFLLSNMAVIIIVLNFYLTGMRMTVLIFRNATGMFWNDRFKPLAEGLVNIIFSIPLAIKFGISGTILGTIISTLLVSFWVEPYVLFKHYFGKSMISYMTQQIKYGIVVVCVAVFTKGICDFVFIESFLDCLVRLLICSLISNTLFLLAFRNKKEFVYFKNIIYRIIKRITNNRILLLFNKYFKK